MSVKRTCCCDGCKGSLCNSSQEPNQPNDPNNPNAEYTYENTSGDCPVCAIGITSYNDDSSRVDYWYGSNDWNGLTISEMESIHHIGEICHRLNPEGPNACPTYDSCEPPLLPPQFLHSGGTHVGTLPWSLIGNGNEHDNTRFNDGWFAWREYNDAPLKPMGDCTMKCTNENIRCHNIAFSGMLSTRNPNGGSDAEGSMDITIPMEGDWDWVKNWVFNGGKLVIFPPKRDLNYSELFVNYRNIDLSLGCNISCDNIGQEENISLSFVEVRQRLLNFASYCSGGEEFFEYGEENISPEPHTYRCYQTNKPFVKVDEHGIERNFRYRTGGCDGIITKRKGKALIGATESYEYNATGEPITKKSTECIAVFKQYGEGAVVVFGGHNPYSVGGPPWSFGGWGEIGPHDSSVYNNDFWKFMGEEFLGEHVPDENCTSISLIETIDLENPIASNYENNPCLPIAACCLPDGECENLNVYECSSKFGGWSGKCYRGGQNPDNYEGMCNNTESENIQDWCCPTCEELEIPCESSLGPCCLIQEVENQDLGEHICTGLKPQWECCKDFRDGDDLFEYGWNECGDECGTEEEECESCIDVNCGDGGPCAEFEICCSDGFCKTTCDHCGENNACEDGLLCCDDGECRESCENVLGICCRREWAQEIDTMFVVDIGRSVAGEEFPSYLDMIATGMREQYFPFLLTEPNDDRLHRVGLIAYGGEAALIKHLTPNIYEVDDAVQNLPHYDGESVKEAIDLARLEFAEFSDANKLKIMIIITRGDLAASSSHEYSALAAAYSAYKEGVNLYVLKIPYDGVKDEDLIRWGKIPGPCLNYSCANNNDCEYNQCCCSGVCIPACCDDYGNNCTCRESCECENCGCEGIDPNEYPACYTLDEWMEMNFWWETCSRQGYSIPLINAIPSSIYQIGLDISGCSCLGIMSREQCAMSVGTNSDYGYFRNYVVEGCDPPFGVFDDWDPDSGCVMGGNCHCPPSNFCSITEHVRCETWPGETSEYYWPYYDCDLNSSNANVNMSLTGVKCGYYELPEIVCNHTDFDISYQVPVTYDGSYNQSSGFVPCSSGMLGNWISNTGEGEGIFVGHPDDGLGCDMVNWYAHGWPGEFVVKPHAREDCDDIEWVDGFAITGSRNVLSEGCPIEVSVRILRGDNTCTDPRLEKFEIRYRYLHGNGDWTCTVDGGGNSIGGMVNTINSIIPATTTEPETGHILAHCNHTNSYGGDEGDGIYPDTEWCNTLFSSLRIKGVNDDEDWSVIWRDETEGVGGVHSDIVPVMVQYRRYPRFKFSARPIVRGVPICDFGDANSNQTCFDILTGNADDNSVCEGPLMFYPEVYTDWTGTYNRIFVPTDTWIWHNPFDPFEIPNFNDMPADDLGSFEPSKLNFLPNEPTPPYFGEVSVDFI